MAETAVQLDVWAGKKMAKEKGSLHPIIIEDVRDLRRYQLERLTVGFRLFAYFGYDEGVAGHITVRDPEHADLFWVNPIGLHFSQLKVSDLLLVNHDGEVIQGNRPVNAAAFAIHSRLHSQHPALNAAAHSHSVYGRTFSTMGRLLDPITQDACAFYEQQALFSEFDGVVLDTSYGDAIAAALGDKKTCILQNHGLLTTGKSVDEAVWRFISMDKCCKSQLLAEATGHKPISIPHDIAIKTRETVGSELACWASFQPLYDMIAEQQPDLFE
ncbi:MAG: class II aldolase/adducin family protein [Gammaproteobacteria bacterium]